MGNRTAIKTDVNYGQQYTATFTLCSRRISFLTICTISLLTCLSDAFVADDVPGVPEVHD